MVYMRFFAQNNLLNMLVKFFGFSAEHSVYELLQQVQDGFISVHNTPGIFQYVCLSMHCWAEAYVAMQFQCFELL
jgi:hypothetical protein